MTIVFNTHRIAGMGFKITLLRHSSPHCPRFYLSINYRWRQVADLFLEERGGSDPLTWPAAASTQFTPPLECDLIVDEGICFVQPSFKRAWLAIRPVKWTHALLMKTLLRWGYFYDYKVTSHLLINRVLRHGLKRKFANFFFGSGEMVSAQSGTQEGYYGRIAAIIQPRTDPLQLLTSRLTTLQPMFALEAEKVSKMVRKHSRGKSGRYSFYWSFLPAFKRSRWVARTFVSHASWDESKTTKERIAQQWLLHLDEATTPLEVQIQKTYTTVFKRYRTPLVLNMRRQKEKRAQVPSRKEQQEESSKNDVV